MSEQTLLKVTVDNITIEVPVGTTVLQVARQIGGAVAPRINAVINRDSFVCMELNIKIDAE